MKRLIRPGLIPLLLAATLVSCSELAEFMSHLDDEVKLANDRYLEIVDVYPAQNDQEINPSVPLLITFDRSVNPEKAADWIVLEVQDSVGVAEDFVDDIGGSLSLKFNSTDNTLTVEPSPFLAGGAKIIVSLAGGLPALDGSILRDTSSWSFYTGKLPAGDLEITDGAGNALPGYTAGPPANLDLSVTANSKVSHYFLTLDGTASELTADNAVGWTAYNPVSPPDTIAFGSPYTDSDGEKTVYIRFYGDDEEDFSPVITDTTILDTTSPTVAPYFSGNRWVNSFATVLAGATDENGIQADQYAWSSPTAPPSGATLTFSSADAASTKVYLRNNSGGALTEVEQDFVIRVSAMDSAGNTAQGDASSTLRWDRFIHEPSVAVYPDTSDGPGGKPDPVMEELLGGTPDPSLHLVSEEYARGMSGVGFQWRVDGADIPYEDIAFGLFGLNDYWSEEKIDKFDFNKDLDHWGGPNAIPDPEPDNYFPLTDFFRPDDNLAGYYQLNVMLVDKPENKSAVGSGYFSWVSGKFIDTLKAAREGEPEATWPPNGSKEVNRYPSFCWPALKEVLEKLEVAGNESLFYYKLFVGKDSPTEITVADITTPFWFHSGPTGLNVLGAGNEVAWWFEIWLDKDKDGPANDTSEFTSLDYYGEPFYFATGEF